MKVSFNEIIRSEAYQQHGMNWAKAGIFVAIITLVGFALLSDTQLGLKWLFALLWALLGTSLLISFPLFVLYVWLASVQSAYSFFPYGRPKNIMGHLIKLTKNTISLLHIFLSGFMVYLIINFIKNN